MTVEVLNPVDIEHGIRACADRIHEGVKVVTQRERIYREATRVYDRAYAHAYLAAEGPAHEKKYRAELATAPERDARDVAEVAFRHAERTARAVEAELRAWQSVGASVRAMYSAQGS
jgi:hypothetical protein